MRIDLVRGGKRPWYLDAARLLLRAHFGDVPGPMLALTYRHDLVHAQLRHYLTRGMHASGAWTKGESELFAAFVSELNRCKF
mgnify:CR=1 FL=1